MSYPKHRLRRLRQSANLRAMVRETQLTPEDLIMPYFVRDGEGIERPISSVRTPAGRPCSPCFGGCSRPSAGSVTSPSGDWSMRKPTAP